MKVGDWVLYLGKPGQVIGIRRSLSFPGRLLVKVQMSDRVIEVYNYRLTKITLIGPQPCEE